jgi:hypothetical protein
VIGRIGIFYGMFGSGWVATRVLRRVLKPQPHALVMPTLSQRTRKNGAPICGLAPGGRADKRVRATRVVVGLRERGAASGKQVPLRLRRFGMTSPENLPREPRD